MQEAETRTPVELSNEQANGTPDAPTSEDTARGQVSEPFSNVTLEDINRENLSPEMQAAYDNLSDKYNNMNRDYTIKTQAIASVNKDAENWRTAINHSEIGPRLSDMVARATSGLPVEGPTYTQSPAPTVQEIDPEANPMEYMLGQIDEKIQTALQPLQQAMGQVSGFVNNTQTQSEFQELAQKFPAIERLGVDQLNVLRSQYSTSTGQPLSLKQAVGLIAVDNPDILVSRPPASTIPKIPVSPRVEPPKTSTGGREETPVPESIAKLRDQVIKKDFKPSLNDAISRAFARLRSRGGA